MKLIDKDALIVEIEKLIEEIYDGQPFDSLNREKQIALWYVKSIMSSINSLEVKEVDLEKEIAKYLGDDWVQDTPKEVQPDMIGYAKHFFELGFKAQKL